MYFDPEFAKNPKGPSSSGRQERSNASRLDEQGRRGGKRELRGLIIGALYENVRRSSSFVLSEIKEDPRSLAAPPPSTEKLSEGSPC